MVHNNCLPQQLVEKLIFLLNGAYFLNLISGKTFVSSINCLLLFQVSANCIHNFRNFFRSNFNFNQFLHYRKIVNYCFFIKFYESFQARYKEIFGHGEFVANIAFVGSKLISIGAKDQAIFQWKL